MKRFLCILFVFLITTAPSFAESNVSLETTPIKLKSVLLNKKYSAYQVIIKNQRKNDIKINRVKLLNTTNGLDETDLAGYFSKTSVTLLCLSPFTLGLTAVIAMPVVFRDYIRHNKAVSESEHFSENEMSLKNEVIVANGEIFINILVPLKEKPFVNVLFEDFNTHEYFEVKNNE